MPIYEYQCEKCQTKFEALRSMKDADSDITCKTCGSSQTKRVLSVCNTKCEGRTSSHSSCSSCSGGSCSSCGH